MLDRLLVSLHFVNLGLGWELDQELPDGDHCIQLVQSRTIENNVVRQRDVYHDEHDKHHFHLRRSFDDDQEGNFFLDLYW